MKNYKEKISLKLYRLIDSLWNSFEKRRRILSLFVFLYWFLQYVLQALFFLSLVQVHDYHSLFAFMKDMDAYTGSILIRIAYRFITIPTVSITSFLSSLWNAMSFFDLLFILLTILWLLQANKKKAGLFIGGNVLMLIVLFIGLMIGMRADSIQSLIQCLHVLSLWSLVAHIVFIVILMFNLVQNCLKWVKTRA